MTDAIVKFLDRLHDDPGFRYRFNEDPAGALRDLDFSETERALLASRSVEAWFQLGPAPPAPKNTASTACVKTGYERQGWSLERDARL